MTRLRFTKNVSYKGREYGPDYPKQIAPVDPAWTARFLARGCAVIAEESETSAPAASPGDGANGAPVSDSKPNAPASAPLTTAAAPPVTTRGSIRGK